jgi:hypothetical protein
MKKKIGKLFLLLRQYLKACDKKKKPCFVKARSMLLVFLVVVFIEFLFIANFFGRISLEHFFASIVPDVLVEMTNIRRDEVDIAELRVDPLLTKAAQKKADDMASKGYFAHTSPEGITPWYWFDFVDYNYRYAGENLAVNFSEAYEVDEAWMKSPKHRDNIVNEKFEEVGIATAEGEYKGKEAIFVVQLFGTRMETISIPTEDEELVEVVEQIEDSEEERILGEEERKEETEEAEETEKAVEEEAEQSEEDEQPEKEESFALIERTEETPSLVIGKPSKIIRKEVEDLEYIPFWGRITSSPEKSLGYLLLIVATVLLFSFALKLLLMRRIHLASIIASELAILLVIFSALLTSHYVLTLAKIFF